MADSPRQDQATKAAGRSQHILNATIPLLRRPKDKGISRWRTKNKGMWGMARVRDQWAWPCGENHYLFPAVRSGCKLPHRQKDTACKATSKLRQTFYATSQHHVAQSTVRSHSGRHRMVNDMKPEVPDEVDMRSARKVSQEMKITGVAVAGRYTMGEPQ